MRFPSRTLVGLLVAAGVAACSDTKTIDAPIPAGMHAGKIAINPEFSPTARTIAKSLADFGITFGQVRVTIRNNPDTAITVLDTTVAFTPSSSPLALDLTVPVEAVGQVFNALVEYIGQGGVVYSGSLLVQSYAPGGEPPEEGALVLNFVGPGSKLKTIAVTPDVVNLVGSQSVGLTIAATDSSGATIAVPPLVFASSDESIAKVVASGSGWAVQSSGKRGEARITALTPIGISDTISARVTLPAASIVLVSGGGQSGLAGAVLKDPAVVQVNDSAGVGVSGVTVTFAAPTGGSVGTPSTTTDANGRASTTMTLGSAVGAQNFVASAAGLTPVTIPAIAASATPRLAAADTAAVVLNTFNTTPTHYPVVVVKNGLGNPVSGQTVTFEVAGIDQESSSPCHINMVSATTDANGSIAFDANTFQFAAGADFPYSCLLIASAVGANDLPLTGSPLLIPVIVQPDSGTTWIGKALDGKWTTAANWSNGAPGPSTAVFVPFASSILFSIPQLSSDVSVGRIELEDGGHLDLNTHKLSVSGDIDGRIGGSISNGIVTNTTGSNGGKISGSLPAFECTSGPREVSSVAVVETVRNSGCRIALNGSSMVVQGDFSQTGVGTLLMNQSSDFVSIGGNATFNGGAETNLLTSGSMLISGNFTQLGTTSSFAASGTHLVQITPGSTAQQTVSIDDVVHSPFGQLAITVQPGTEAVIPRPIFAQTGLQVFAPSGGTLTLSGGLWTQTPSGPITVSSGSTLVAKLGGTILTSGLTFGTGSTVTLEGDAALNITGGVGALNLQTNTRLTINGTGSFAMNSGATCTAGTNVKIDGMNTTAVNALRRACGLIAF